MSAAGVIRFGVCVAAAAIWWVFLAPMIDTLNFLEPIGNVISQQRLDCQNSLILGFKISPILLLLATGIQFWATSLRRSAGPSGGVRLVSILGVYVTQVILLVICIACGPVIDELTLRFAELPAVNTTISLDMAFLGLTWLYPLLTVIMIVLYVGLFFAIGRNLIYTGQASSKPNSKYW